MTAKINTGLRKANDREKQSCGRDEVKKWPLNGNFMAIWDKFAARWLGLRIDPNFAIRYVYQYKMIDIVNISFDTLCETRR